MSNSATPQDKDTEPESTPNQPPVAEGETHGLLRSTMSETKEMDSRVSTGSTS